MVRTVLLALVLFGLWLLMSGVYKPLVIGLGAGSALAAACIVRRMARLDGYRAMEIFNPLRAFTYFLWLLKEIALSNIAVTKVILSGGATMRQNLFRVNNTQKTDLGAVVYANSITLTPGTLTVEIGPDHFWIHALAYDDSDIYALADMDAHITALEPRT
ncbi:MAG: Na+/H+ antiporter subunit E [Rhodobacteraceae bacterium]|nr:Na+/H+ antiporter subunit E [Paracoccaceae bacterium]